MNTHLVVTEDAVSGFPCSEVGMGRVRTSKRTRDDAETSCDSSYYGISNENSVLSQEGAENGDSSPPPRVHIARVVKKKTKVQPQLITGVRIMDDGSTSPLTAAPQQREPSADKVNVLTIKSKKRGASQDPPRYESI